MTLPAVDLPVWTPSPEQVARTNIAAFVRWLREAAVPGFASPAESVPNDEYGPLYAWSVAERERFWPALARFCGVLAEGADGAGADGAGAGDPWGDVGVGLDRMAPPDAERGPRWFPRARLNFAENLLRWDDDRPALLSWSERGRERALTHRELRSAALRVAAALRAHGVGPGDRIAGWLPNVPEAVIAMLGAAAVGAVWSSCSPDFGVQGVLDRFGQIGPRLLVCADGYRYAGKSLDCLARAREIVRRLPTVERVVVVRWGDAEVGSLDGLPNGIWWEEWLDRAPRPAPPVPSFARLPFDHPLVIMYSSGTTGLPKCMVHGAGGTLLQHLKEHVLHTDVTREDRVFYFTTCGWMMWNWLVSALATGAAVVLYDGAPLAPRPRVLWDMAERERVTVFGTSAKYLALAEKEGVRPAETHDLSALRAVLSTGSPLAAHSFDYVYRDVRPGVHLASISGGTDLISCFALGCPTRPVWRGELQCRGLGMAVDVWGDDGAPVRGAAGELVCTAPFPSMPVAFWNDPGGAKYRAAYFEHFPGVWRHGDWAELTEHDGLVIYGRSDATLNPGGVRIGTAEIYRQVEQLPEVVESLAIGQETGGDAGDVRVVLFVRLREGVALDDALRDRIRRRVREHASPHHVPRKIIQVADIPRTVSGKISEIAVREVVHGRPVKNTEALANPQALALYRDLPDLRS